MTWPHEVATVLAFLSWQMLLVGRATRVSDCWPLCSGPVLRALREEEEGGLLTLPPPRPQAAPCLMPPLPALTSETDPRPAGHGLKPHTVTTQPPPMAAPDLSPKTLP